MLQNLDQIYIENQTKASKIQTIAYLFILRRRQPL